MGNQPGTAVKGKAKAKYVATVQDLQKLELQLPAGISQAEVTVVLLYLKNQVKQNEATRVLDSGLVSEVAAAAGKEVKGTMSLLLESQSADRGKEKVAVGVKVATNLAGSSHGLSGAYQVRFDV